MKFYILVSLAACFLMIKDVHSKAHKRTSSCKIPEDARGSWRAPDFETDKGKLVVSIDVGATSATLHQTLGDKKTEIQFDCTSGGDNGYYLAKSDVPESYKSLYEQMRALYKLEANTCLKFDKNGDFLTVYMYSFKKEPSSQNPDEVCSKMDKEERFNAIGFSPADEFKRNDPQKHSY